MFSWVSSFNPSKLIRSLAALSFNLKVSSNWTSFLWWKLKYSVVFIKNLLRDNKFQLREVILHWAFLGRVLKGLYFSCPCNFLYSQPVSDITFRKKAKNFATYLTRSVENNLSYEINGHFIGFRWKSDNQAVLTICQSALSVIIDDFCINSALWYFSARQW